MKIVVTEVRKQYCSDCRSVPSAAAAARGAFIVYTDGESKGRRGSADGLCAVIMVSYGDLSIPESP